MKTEMQGCVEIGRRHRRKLRGSGSMAAVSFEHCSKHRDILCPLTLETTRCNRHGQFVLQINKLEY